MPVTIERLAKEITILAAKIDDLIARVNRLELQVGPDKPQGPYGYSDGPYN